jgi:flagellar hook-associated protein 1 FlgK
MSLSAIFGSGLTGLQAAQAGMRTVSQNIANVNTPGYARAEISFESSFGGVSVTGVKRAADAFLAAAALKATATQSGAGALSDLLDRAQASFGDPTSTTSLFASLSTMFTRFGELASDPSNTLRKSNAAQAAQGLLTQMSSVGSQLESLRVEADQRLGESVGVANDLMSRIAGLNGQIAIIRANGGDTTSAENAQSQLIDQLAGYVDIRATPRDLGGVEIRTTAGALLVSDQAVTLAHSPMNSAFGQAGGLSYIDRNGTSHPMEGLVQSGTLAALIKARDVDLPQLGDALGELAGATADALNAVHNNSTSVPPATSLVGRQTGLLATDLLGFTGKTTLAVTDPSGNLLHTVAIDFSARTYSVDGGAATTWPATETVAQFASDMNAALGTSGTVSFSGGVLTVTGGASNNGVFFQDDATSPSSRGGRGFSQFFGLNDLVTRPTPIFFETGFKSTDAHGLTAGGALSFRVLDSNGREVLNRSVGVTGTTWVDMTTALNASGTGLGSYGSFALDANGKMSATMANGYRIEITGDTTQRGALSMSDLFGLDRQSTAGRAVELSVNSNILADPTKLAVARPDLTAVLGSQVLESGDGRGALALANAINTTRNFSTAGGLSAQSSTLNAYASLVGGDAGRRAADADNARSGAESVLTAASARRSAVEGVQLDNELVKMTQFQQSYAASSRLIQAARDMFDILLQLK